MTTEPETIRQNAPGTALARDRLGVAAVLFFVMSAAGPSPRLPAWYLPDLP